MEAQRGFTAERERIVDEGMLGEPFGFSGMSMVSTRDDASALYRLVPEDDELEVAVVRRDVTSIGNRRCL